MSNHTLLLRPSAQLLPEKDLWATGTAKLGQHAQLKFQSLNPLLAADNCNPLVAILDFSLALPRFQEKAEFLLQCLPRDIWLVIIKRGGQ
ncbi:hypothetical protein NC651_012077 [Populus alba x Populus x berolinensis]|nr:hypothetical protein NC651_012077 [Populus alba x Populus x berolinensis]